MEDSAIKLTNLSKKYGNTKAVDELSLTIPQGVIYGLLGPNGAGKTTTIELITGVKKPDSGTIQTLDTTIDANEKFPSLKELRKNVGIVPEQENPPSYQTPREYFVELIGAGRDIPTKEINERMKYWTDKFNLEEQYLDTYTKNLSRGQQQKVMLIGAVIHNPDLLIIDEPLANLDINVQEKVKEELKRLNREEGTTILLSTHQANVAEELCDEISIMLDGKVVDTFKTDSLEIDLTQHFINTTQS